MEVLIVSKTHMSNAACVGGLVLANNQYVRLLNQGGYNQPTDTPFRVGNIWDMDFHPRPDLHPPHVEDVIITSKSFLRNVPSVSQLLNQRSLVNWRGHINNVLDGQLHWTNSGTGYIPLGGQMPSRSVGFWTPDKDLIRVVFDNKTRYRYPNSSQYRNISYVGYQDTISVIPAGTILRLSLSRIFPPADSTIQTPRGYYLQLSGWYEIDNNETELPDDLPF